jgi:hypothetical protein
MAKWIHTGFNVHAIACYVAYIIFLTAAVLVDGPSHELSKWIGIVVFGILAPVTVPFLLFLTVNSPRNTHIEPRAAGFALWGGYILSMTVLILLLNKQRIAEKRARTGFCFKCGYDLRATPARCPECGLIPAKKEIISVTP